MPTIQQLPVATSVGASDELPLSQAGLTVSVTVDDLLAGTQAKLTTATNTLLGRVSLGAGGPEPVGVGTGLQIAGGALAATGADHVGFPALATMSGAEQVVVNAGGVPSVLPVTALRGLYSAGSNVTIDSNGVISARAGTSGLGSMAVQQANAVAITGGTISGVDASAAQATAQAGLVARSLAMRFADAVNINDFGLVRDGVTDDSAKVVLAVAAANAKGGQLYVPSGGPILMGGAAQVALQGIAILGDGLTDFGFPYGSGGSQFWISDTARSPFTLGTAVTIEGVCFYYPNQFDQPSAPIVYPPLFGATPGASAVASISFHNIQVTNAYDFLTVPQSMVAGNIYITDSRICVINTCLTLPNVPEVVYLIGNLFSFGVFQDEYLHYAGGGTHAQTLHVLTLAAAAVSGATQITVADASAIQVGWPVQGANIPYYAVVQAVSGNVITLSAATTGAIASGTAVTAVENRYYLRTYTAENGTWMLITGNGTPSAVSTVVHGGVVASNNYVFGFRYGIHVSGGNLAIGRFSNCGFDQVGTILQVDNNGTCGDVQFGDFIVYGLLADGSAAAPTLFAISNPPPNNAGGPSAMLSVTGMTVGFHTGTLFDIQGQNVAEIKVTDSKLTRFANTSVAGSYYAMHVNAPRARLVFGMNDVLPAGNGGSGVRIDAVGSASIVGNSFTGLGAAVDVETTSGLVVLSGNVATGTVGGAALTGLGAGNVVDLGNSWDKAGYSYNGLRTAYVANAANGLVVKGDGGSGASLATVGSGANVPLNLVTSGSGGIGFLTRGYLPQFGVSDNPNAVSILNVSGASSGNPVVLTASGSQNNGVWLYGSGAGPTQLGSLGSTGSAISFQGAVADKSYSQVTPVSAGTVVVQNNCSTLQLIPATALASLVVKLPAAPVDGQIVTVATTQAIASLSVQANAGQTLLGAPSSLGANAATRFMFQNGVWYAYGSQAGSAYAVVNGTVAGNYTIQQADNGTVILTSDTAAVTYTLPPGLAVGMVVQVVQGAGGQVQFVGASGVTVSNRQGNTRTGGQNAAVRLLCVAANAWNLAGDTVP